MEPAMSKGRQTKTRILDAAVRLASRDGLGGLTIGRLADALSLSKAGLFAHFGSKEALQNAVLDHAGSLYQARVIAPLPSAISPQTKLKRLLEGCMDWVDDPAFTGGCPIMSACFELTAASGTPWDNLAAKQHSFQNRLTQMFRDVGASPTQAELAAFEFRGVTFSYQHSSRVLSNTKARKLARLALEAILARIRPPA
jgi:AcrR family transcriptional regulator